VFKSLRIRFENLERFEDDVVVELTTSLTVIVGPNGSGKSTILEAVAEVLSFFQLQQLEAPKAAVRASFRLQRSSEPRWTRALVELVPDKSIALGSTLQNLLESRQEDSAYVELQCPTNSDHITVAEIGLGSRRIEFDTSASIIVDDAKKIELEKSKKNFDQKFQEIHQQLVKEIEQLSRANETKQKPSLSAALSGARNTAATSKGPTDTASALTALTTSISASANIMLRQRRQKELDELKEKQKYYSEKVPNEIALATLSAIKTKGSGELAKRDVESFIRQLELPPVLYLQGAADVSELLKSFTARLVELRAKKYAELDSSPYKQTLQRVSDLLKMRVTIDSGDNHLLLINDRPYTQLSSGTWQALGFAALCEPVEKTSLIIWDEPESGLHPTLARKMCDLMLADRSRRFLIATHRTEFVPICEPALRAYKSHARLAKDGDDKAICKISEATAQLSEAMDIALTLGFEPSKILFTTNAILWVEGPSDVIYWRTWLSCAAKQRRVALVEGFDFSFMFSGGSLLASESVVDTASPLAGGAVNLLNIVGASLIISDTDFSPHDTSWTGTSLADLNKMGAINTDTGIRPELLSSLKPRVSALALAIKKLGPQPSSRMICTWGREAENALSDEAFRRTLHHIYDSTSEAVGLALNAIAVDPWKSFDDEIPRQLQAHVGVIDELTGQSKSGAALAKSSIIRDKTLFATHYSRAHASEENLDSLRPEARAVVYQTIEWILGVRRKYNQ
jgi:predicted ATP-dependent endonuclease of OLD family